MARACQTKTASDICIGITGTAGNTDPSNEGASVPGTVYFCIYFYDNTDNRFNPPVGRFPTIEEDEAPYRLLCNEYPVAK